MVSWIRVNAALADDVQVRRFAVELLPERRPREAVAAVCGLMVALWGELASHAPSGDVSGCDDDQIEAWARWWGEPGAFAAAWRREFTSRGRVQDWDDYNGAALRRMAEDAERKRRSRVRRPSGQRSLDLDADSPPPVRRMSSVDGDGNGDGQLQADRVVRAEFGPESVLEPSPPAPPADQVIRTEHGEVTFPADAQALLERFYAKDPVRMADAARQLVAALGPGAVLERGVAVRAVDTAHLAGACRAVLAEPPIKRELAARFVLLKLRDTFLEVRAERDTVEHAQERQEKDDRLGEARQYVDTIGGLWDRIESEVDALLPHEKQGRPSPARNILLEAAILDALERQRTLGSGSGPVVRRLDPGVPEVPLQPWKPAEPAPERPAEIPAELLEE